jgi:glycosyltransferase involved in cell wall biosynthesis
MTQRPAEPVPFVSVVVPHYNDLDNLRRCLAALRAQTWPADRFEIIVADNNSAGGTAAVRALDPAVTAVPAPIQGAGPARNAGVAQARGEVLAFIDSDCFAEPGWLEAGVAALRRFDYVGGQVVTAIGAPEGVTPSEAYEAVFAFDFRKYIEKDKFSGSGNLFVPRAVFDQVGGFRSGVSEDVEWCRRANALGYRLGYAERAIVRHPARCRWPELKRKWDRVIPERIRLMQEGRFWRLRVLAHAAVVVVSPAFHWVRVVASPRLVGLRGKLVGLYGLVMVRSYRGYRMLATLLSA